MSWQSRSGMWAALFSALLTGHAAWADAVPPPPASCPPGTVGFTNHVAQGCAPADCTSDASCSSGQVCAQYPLCVRRWVSHSFRGDSYSAEVSGPCDQGKCPAGEGCEDKPHCVPSSFVPRGAPKGSTSPVTSAAPGGSAATGSSPQLPIAHAPSTCGCAVPGRGGDLESLGVALVGAALLIARRARRRPTK